MSWPKHPWRFEVPILISTSGAKGSWRRTRLPQEMSVFSGNGLSDRLDRTPSVRSTCVSSPVRSVSTEVTVPSD